MARLIQRVMTRLYPPKTILPMASMQKINFTTKAKSNIYFDCKGISHPVRHEASS